MDIFIGSMALWYRVGLGLGFFTFLLYYKK